MREIRIATESGDRPVMAHVYGDWAAHRSLDAPEGWSVTHVPSGRRCAGGGILVTEREAIEIANTLDDEADFSAWDGAPREIDVEVTPEMTEALRKVYAIVRRVLIRKAA